MKGGKRQAELLEKFDKSGDGGLGAEEMNAVKADKKQKMKMQELIQKRHDSHKKK